MIAAATILAASQASAATGDWPQYGFTAAGRRENTQETVLTRKTVPHLVQKWSAPIAVDVASAPAVANGLVYVGSDDDHLYALDARTGAQVWSAATGGPIWSSPAVADGVVYVGSADSYVYAFDAETGVQRWATLVGYPVASPVTVAKGLVYAGTGAGAFAISAKTGKVKWTTGPSVHIELAAPAVSDGIAYFGNAAGTLSAFDARSGASLWSQNIFPYENFVSAPATSKGSVFISDGLHLWAFDAKTGQVHWTNQDADAVDSGIAIAGDHVYVADETGLLQTYDAATGALKWTDTGQFRDWAVPALANGVIYLGGAGGNTTTLSAYDTRTGKPLWQDQATRRFGIPAVSNGMLYAAKDDMFTAYGLP
jgi:outer membrane protein assembly factor BamB